jgi:hypothetical protein
MEKNYKSLRDFISDEHRSYKFQVGKVLASALSGFMAGVIFSAIFLLTAIGLINLFKDVNHL